MPAAQPFPFADRRAAGRALAAHLAPLAGAVDLVLALPRGGVPVGYEVARALGLPLDVLVVRKLGLPGHEELAMGAIALGGVVVRNEEVIAAEGVSEATVAAVVARERVELQRRERAYRGERPAPRLAGERVLLVDDGIATGSTMVAAIRALRAAEVAWLGAAVPVAPRGGCAALDELADAAYCLHSPEPFRAVGLWYDDFRQTSDGEVRALLAR